MFAEHYMDNMRYISNVCFIKLLNRLPTQSLTHFNNVLRVGMETATHRSLMVRCQ